MTQLEAFLLQWFLCSSDQRANGEHCPTIDQDRVVAVLSLECEVLGVLPGELAIQSAAIRQLETQHSLLTNPGLDQPDTGQTGVKARGIHGVESKNAISTCTPAKTSDHVNQLADAHRSQSLNHRKTAAMTSSMNHLIRTWLVAIESRDTTATADRANE